MVEQGTFREAEMRALLGSGKYPARNIDQNIADLAAQVAANEKGVQELHRMVKDFGLDVVHAYMDHVRANAAEQVRRVIDRLKDGAFTYEMDDGAKIAVAVTVDRAKLRRHGRFHRHQPAARQQLQRALRRRQGRRALRLPHLIDDEIPMNAAASSRWTSSFRKARC